MSFQWHLTDIEKQEAKGRIFTARISVIALVPFWPRATKFGTVTHVGVGVTVSHAPSYKTTGPRRPQIFGTPHARTRYEKQ